VAQHAAAEQDGSVVRAPDPRPRFVVAPRSCAASPLVVPRVDGIAEPVSKDGAAGWSLTWRDGQPEIVWPSIAWHPLDETEGSFRERVEHYIARMNSLPGTTPTPDSFHKLDFDALALEHVAGLT